MLLFFQTVMLLQMMFLDSDDASDDFVFLDSNDALDDVFRQCLVCGFCLDVEKLSVCTRLGMHYTPSIAFRHLLPDSARFSYAIEGTLFISALLSSDAISALRKVRVLI